MNNTRPQQRDGHSPNNTINLDIAQHYAIFTINYCEGQYLPDYHHSDASSTLTHCESPSLSRHFNIITIIEKALEDIVDQLSLDLNVDDVDWPDSISNAFQYLKSTQTVMVVFFVAGVGFGLLLSIVALLAVCISSRWVSMALFIFAVVSQA